MQESPLSEAAAPIRRAVGAGWIEETFAMARHTPQSPKVDGTVEAHLISGMPVILC